MDKNRELHELLYPGKDCTYHPDYAADPRLVLREMDKHPKGKLFYAWLMYQDNAEAIDDDGLIERDYMTDLTGKLCSRAIYFLKGVGK